MDRLDPGRRSENMRRIRPRDTGPEMLVRKLIHGMGFRYRLHRRDLPGKPDIVLPAKKKVIFVNGCFWHRHPGCQYAYVPKSRVQFWTSKLEGNRQRDIRNAELLNQMGWHVLTVWECDTTDMARLSGILRGFLGNRNEAGAKLARKNQ
jgi:DNA mismatch endonuclease, patch repair protein